MAAFLAPGFGAGYQSFTNQGVVNAGGKIETYQAGTTTLKATWTDSTQATQNGNPIVLDSAGRPPQEIWLQSGVAYKFIVKDANNATLGTYDNLVGVNDTVPPSISEWIASGLTPTFVNAATFTVPGNQTILFPGRRVRVNLSGSTVYGYIESSNFSGGLTTVVVFRDSGNFDSTISSFDIGILAANNYSTPRRPSFSARTSGLVTGVSSPTQCTNWVTENFDSFGEFSTVTGLFTAAVPGVYIFTADVIFSTNGSGFVMSADIYCISTGVQIAQAQTPSNLGASATATATLAGIYRLAAGNTVALRVAPVQSVQSAQGLTFAGAMIS